MGEGADLARQDAIEARQNACNAHQVQYESEHEMDIDNGIIMGPRHCAFEDCDQKLENEVNGVFCTEHRILHGHLCHIADCDNYKEPNTKTCIEHDNRWRSHLIRFGHQSLLGIRRILHRTDNERLDWLPPVNHQVAPAHDNPPAANICRNKQENYFVAPRYYCVETICAPCGIVKAWTKFTKSEGPVQILDFLNKVYTTEESRPSYICIDKACVVLQAALLNGVWEVWSRTSRLIVDSYHYINHRTTNYICRKWCNPAPLNGSAPNLVVVEYDINGRPHYKRAFNTQACEQLNAWLGGYQSILNRVTVANFDWTIHALLFIHTQKVIQHQLNKASNNPEEEEEEQAGDEYDREEEEEDIPDDQIM
ncbi:hypothetical protein BDQ17DRAFT_1393674 [Cyathus striatus]|nr:hypothetical protein BDQ17DRAFT_1393674 [Cyathus striatus]